MRIRDRDGNNSDPGSGINIPDSQHWFFVYQCSSNQCCGSGSGINIPDPQHCMSVFRIHDILGWIRIQIRIRGSMPLTNGSGFGSGSCYFPVIFNTIFSAYYFLKVHLYHFSKIKSQKESQNSRNQGFSYYFCMMIEGSGSGSIPLTSGSGSERPKNMWIRFR